MTAASRRLLLGPQRPVIHLDDAFAKAEFGDGPVAVISAAWQEAEGDIDIIGKLLGRSVFDLGLYRRGDQIFTADQELLADHRRRQQQLKELQRLYRLRLKQLMIAARSILRADGDQSLLLDERRHAIAQLRALDRHHLHQIRKVHARFDAKYNVDQHDLLAQHHAVIAKKLSQCETILLTGGNVVVLINRLRLLGLDRLLPTKNLAAWSAGAMVLTDRIVLFHDRLPQGRRDPELMCEGLGLVPGIVVLPQGSVRLRTDQTLRMRLFSRRFSPSTCVTLDNGAHVLFDGSELRSSNAARRLNRNGKLKKFRAI